MMQAEMTMAPSTFWGMYLKTGVRTSSTIITRRAACKPHAGSVRVCVAEMLAHNKKLQEIESPA